LCACSRRRHAAAAVDVVVAALPSPSGSVLGSAAVPHGAAGSLPLSNGKSDHGTQHKHHNTSHTFIMVSKPTTFCILGKCHADKWTLGAALAQEVRAVDWQQEGRWFDPRAPPSQVSLSKTPPNPNYS